MPIDIGARLGPYEVTGLLGAGGMGEVYRARDTRLQRQVALKVLPERFARDADRLARFEREAQVLASLNHPNIAAIHGLEESSGVLALVLELVEGPTLADRLVTGPIAVEDALPIARQIADALEAAHEHGVIHRDLKPANVKLRPDGAVKVLDFGLAKLTGPAEARSHAGYGPSEGGHYVQDASPTITTPAMTGIGMILGTAAYMSPEQAKGRAADKRSDIWAFGCVLYEMLTGTRVFDADDVSDTLALVLTKEPDWNALPKATPESIARLLRRSLAKDRKRRLSDISDARIELDEASEPRAIEQHSHATQARVLGARERVVWSVGVLVAVAIAAVTTFAVLRSRIPPDPPEMRVDIVTPATTDPASFALSPDGRQLVFAASGNGDSQLWIRSLDAETARALAGTEGATYPFWSPNGRSIGFFAGGKLKRIDVGGGAPRNLANAAPGFGGTWSPDDVILFSATTAGPLFRVSANGGEATPLTKLDPPRQVGHHFPIMLPGGREFLMYARGTTEGQGIYVGSLDSPDVTRLTSADRPPIGYLTAGWLLFVQEGILTARRYDARSRSIAADSIAVSDSVVSGGTTTITVNPAAFSASSGMVAYRTGSASRAQLTWFNRAGQMASTLGAPEFINNPELSRDDRRVAVRRVIENNYDIWLVDEARTIRFTFEVSAEQYASWSPDGNWLAYSAARKGLADLYRKQSSGAGSEELLLESPLQKNVDDWSPDGRFLMYNAEDPATGRDLWVLPIEGDRKPLVFLKTKFEEHRGQFSPDGHFVAYVSNESGRHEIYVRPFPGPGGQWQISAEGGIQPRWSRDEKEIYFIAPDAKLMATTIAVKNGAIEPGTPKALFQTRIPGGGTTAYTRQQYDVSSDGRFLVNTTLDEAVTSPITLLLNWKPSMARR